MGRLVKRVNGFDRRVKSKQIVDGICARPKGQCIAGGEKPRTAAGNADSSSPNDTRFLGANPRPQHLFHKKKNKSECLKISQKTIDICFKK